MNARPYQQPPMGAGEFLIVLLCTIAALAILATGYWFLLEAAWALLPANWLQGAAFVLYLVAVIGTYNLLRLTTLRKFLLRLHDRSGLR